MTPGERAYAADVAARPTYDDGTTRAPWSALTPVAKWSWERDPRPRFGPYAGKLLPLAGEPGAA